MNEIEIPVDLPDFLKKHLELKSSKLSDQSTWGVSWPCFTFILKTLSDYNFWLAYKETILNGVDKIVSAATNGEAAFVEIRIMHPSNKETDSIKLEPILWFGMTSSADKPRHGLFVWKLSKHHKVFFNGRLYWWCE